MIDRNLEFLERVAHAQSPATWRFEGRLVMERDGQSREGGGGSSLSFVDGKAEAIVVVPGYMNPEPQQYSGYWTLRGKGLISRRAFCYSVSLKDATTTYYCTVDDLWWGAESEEATATREIYLGMTLSHHAPTLVAGNITSYAFGRRFIARSYASVDRETVDAIQCAYMGQPLDAEEQHALKDVMRLFCGSRGNSSFVERFNRNAELIGFHYRNFGSTWRGNAIRPLDFSPWSTTTNVVNKSLPAMLQKTWELRKARKDTVSAAIHHYNDGAIQTYPTSSIRDFLVALAALSSLVEGNRREGQLLPPIIDAVERLGVELDSTEKQTLLDCWWSVIMTGHRGDESDPDSFQRNIRASAICASVFTRAMFSLLGYEGRDFADLYSRAAQVQGDEKPKQVPLKKSKQERVRERIEELGLPSEIRDVRIQESTDEDDEPRTIIVFSVDPGISDDAIRRVNSFAETVRLDLTRSESVQWPHIRLEPFGDNDGAP
jgi:hypothetical protein